VRVDTRSREMKDATEVEKASVVDGEGVGGGVGE